VTRDPLVGRLATSDERSRRPARADLSQGLDDFGHLADSSHMNVKADANAKASPVRAARERAGLTREQAAVRAGLSSSTLYLAERAGLISDETAAKLAAALGVEARELKP
jgi:DNA-binding XRE family transcriptional regulator